MSKRMTWNDPERRDDLRDWYAGLAMQGILNGFRGDFPLEPSLLADRAYELADAMIMEREVRVND
jgi:hypothetical protein